MKRCFLIVFGLALLCGCASNRIHPEFFEVVHSHQALTSETIDAVIASIRGEMNERTDLAPEQLQIIQGLIDRLELIKQQADVMDRYVLATQVDQELLRELLRRRWTNPEGKSVPKTNN